MNTISDKKDVSKPSPGIDILIVDDEANIRKILTRCLELEEHQVTAVGNAQDALEAAARHVFDLVFLDLRLGTAKGMDLIQPLLASSPWIKIVMITAYASVDTAVEALKKGVMDYLPKPFTPDQVKEIAARVAEMRRLERLTASSAESTNGETEASDLNTRSSVLQKAVTLAKQVAQTETCVLMRGESGTGKGVIARAIHQWSKRSEKPFAVVSCPSLSPELLESELFGHARGAFTGAIKDHPGRIELCEGGTLFLDEVGDLPSSVQPKLLRFLQEQEYERVGEGITRKANVRLITATNMDLEKAVKEGRFREDLLYRLNVFQIDLPPLRERRDDILPLAEKFLAVFLRKNGRTVLTLSAEVKRFFQEYSWPGNVRELRNVLERASIVTQGHEVHLSDLPPQLASQASTPVSSELSLDAVEENHIRRVLAATKTLEEAARILGIDLTTLWRKRKKYGI
jgi:NtrC-family two-component system response regulator AlgB